MNNTILEYLKKITEEEQMILDGAQIKRELYAAGGDFVVDSRRMLQSGRYIDVRPHTRFAPFPLHSHNYIEMMYVFSGSISHIIDGSGITLEKGDLLILNPASRHEILTAGADDIGVNFIILPEFLNSVFEKLDYENKFIAMLYKRDAAYLHFKATEIPPIQNLIENLAWLLISEKTDTEILQTTMQLLFMHIADSADNIKNGGTLSGLEAEINRYIDSGYKTATLSEFARKQHHSESNMSKLIFKATGKTFKELLKERRLKSAAGLLIHSDISVSDIISATGYDNTSYFYRIFREKYGMSPKEYRRRKK